MKIEYIVEAEWVAGMNSWMSDCERPQKDVLINYPSRKSYTIYSMLNGLMQLPFSLVVNW